MIRSNPGTRLEFIRDATGQCTLTVDHPDIHQIRVSISAAMTLTLRDFFVKATLNGPLEELRVSYDVASGEVAKSGDAL